MEEIAKNNIYAETEEHDSNGYVPVLNNKGQQIGIMAPTRPRNYHEELQRLKIRLRQAEENMKEEKIYNTMTERINGEDEDY